MHTAATTGNGIARSIPRARDHGSHRRAYLDTYARRRSGLKDQPQTQQLTPAQVKPEPAADLQASPIQTMPTEIGTMQPGYTPGLYQALEEPVATPEVIATPQAATPPASPQPVVTPAPSLPPAARQTASQPEPPQAPTHHAKTGYRRYLDTLTHRHQTAVAQAPAGTETVSAPSLSQETQQLLDEKTTAEERISANLRALYEGDTLTNQLTKSTQSASAAHVRTIVASAVTCGVLAVGVFSFLTRVESQPVVAQPVGAPVIEVEVQNNPAPQGAATAPANQAARVPADPRDPVRMVIGGIGVNAPVEGVGTTADGLLDVPRSYGVVGWYNKGVRPGAAGPAVLVGHYTAGSGGVFDRLQSLNDGDLITLTNGHGESFTYQVTKKVEYAKDKVPMAELFKKSDNSRLEIITCAGKWQANNYDKRLVVSAELVR